MGVTEQTAEAIHTNTVYRKTMFAAHIQRASLAALSRVGSSTAARSLLSTSCVVRQAIQPAGFAKLKQRQKTFNVDNGKRVHQRGGFMDHVMYNVTIVVILIGGVEWVRMSVMCECWARC